ncbi:uncharacterized protein LOC133856591 [Alnus glutinosa]|uniref:uncharacterized protein LOC133856591 n=1 Tax=Alnus glutinosa TaxID=3517 RepID=UPI002D77BFF5|nr:uncharacterized protein LOC133856591 [Alnus glutinosa]
MSPPLPPLQPITNRHITTLPDLFLTAISICCFLFPSKSFPFHFPFPSRSRRSLKISTMSLPPQTLKTHHSNSFTTPQSLSEWLKPRLPSDSFAAWGVKPGTKNVHNLWLELAEGETSLADSIPPIRTVQVVTVRIIDKHNRVLIEARQELSDGSWRDRNRPLSEKMKPNETTEAAVYRAVREELGQIIKGSVGDSENESVVRIVPGSYRKKLEERNSASYPGLPACYVLHSVDAVVEGLPEGEFCTEEEENRECEENRRAVACEAVSVKKHYWEWVSADSTKS